MTKAAQSNPINIAIAKHKLLLAADVIDLLRAALSSARAEALEEAALFIKAIDDAKWGIALDTIDYLVDGIRALKERKP